MADLATLQAQRATLEAARASGEARITHASGRTVVYRTVDEIERAISAIDRELVKAANDSKPSVTRAVVTRG